MKLMTAGVYQRLAHTQQEAMNDLCNIYHVSFATGTYSDDETKILTGTFNIPCGIHFTGGQITQRGQVLLVDYDAILRIPSTQSIGMADEIQLIEKGVTVISGTFIPFDYPVDNSSVQHVKLHRQIS